MSNIKVAARVRPLNEREAKKKGRSVIEVRRNVVSIENPKHSFEDPLHEGFESLSDALKHFIFDFAFSPSPHFRLSSLLPSSAASDEDDSFLDLSPEELRHQGRLRGIYVDPDEEQEAIYQDIGVAAEVSVVKGYNACILAYGQSGSGKTYTVLGCKESPGLSPRICEGLLTRLREKWPLREGMTDREFSLSLSLIEIYKEKVRDLLTEVKPPRVLKVREHPITGPYVDGLTWHRIGDVEIAWSLLERGRAARSVGPTSVHAHSSRSHALMTLEVGQPAIHTKSALTLVDLAGSERAGESSDKNRLKEGASINRSLVTLGNVISALGKQRLIEERRF